MQLNTVNQPNRKLPARIMIFRNLNCEYNTRSKFIIFCISLFALFFQIFSFGAKAASTKNLLIFKEAKMLESTLFVLGKNNSLYAINSLSGKNNKLLELENIRGIFQNGNTLFTWNKHQVFSINTIDKQWNIVHDFDKNAHIKSLKMIDNELIVAFADHIYFSKSKSTVKCPFPISHFIEGNSPWVLTTNNYLYSFTDKTCTKIAKLDSAKQVSQFENNIVYNTNSGLRIFNTLNKKTDYLNTPIANNQFLGSLGEYLFFNTGEQIIGYNYPTLSSFTLLSGKYTNIALLNNENILYNDAAGECMYYTSKTKTTLQVGTDIKSFSIIDHFENPKSAISIAHQGYIFNQVLNAEQIVTDISSSTGKIYKTVKVNTDLLLACEKGLFLFNTELNTCAPYTYFNNIICNGLCKTDNYIYICSTEKGVYKFKLNKLHKMNLEPDLMNEGLLSPSAYIIDNYDDILCLVSPSGVYQSPIKSGKWTEFSRSAFVPKITGITYYKKQRNALFIASAENGIIKTNNEGRSYESVNLGLPDTSIVNIASDSNGFYALTKSGQIYFHDHAGVEWLPLEKETSLYGNIILRDGILYMIDKENNISKQPTWELKPGIEVTWALKNSYVNGEKVVIPYRTFGFFGKDNQIVLQITKRNTDFSDNYIGFSDAKQGQLSFTIHDSITPEGEYSIRLVTTEPFFRSEKATNTFTVVKETPLSNKKTLITETNTAK